MTTPASFELGQFHVEMPRFIFPQGETLEWLTQAHAAAASRTPGVETGASGGKDRTRERLLRFGCKPSQISARGFDTVDIRNHDFAGDGLYGFGPAEVGGTSGYRAASHLGARSRFFLGRSSEILRKIYPPTAAAPDHLIHVSCTGYASPSAAQRLVDGNDWCASTAVTHAYHMGCYASLPAIRMADGIMHSLGAKGSKPHQTDIVHTEICTLHINPFERSPDQYVIQSLFSDGHIKYSLLPAGSLKTGFRVHGVTEQLIRGSTEDMTWVPDDWGFRMVLSREVPQKIGANLRAFLTRLAQDSAMDLADLLKHAVFAIHPGGPRIIASVQEILELRDDQTAHSKQVLFERGNMSSATLPHVWNGMIRDGVPAGTKVVSLAFGPGLTIFGAIFTVL